MPAGGVQRLPLAPLTWPMTRSAPQPLFNALRLLALLLLAFCSAALHAREVLPGLLVAHGEGASVMAIAGNPPHWRFLDTAASWQPVPELDRIEALGVLPGGIVLAGHKDGKCMLLMPDGRRLALCAISLKPASNGSLIYLGPQGEVGQIHADRPPRQSCRLGTGPGSKGGGLRQIAPSPDGLWAAGLDFSGALRDTSDPDVVRFCNLRDGSTQAFPLARDADPTWLAWSDDGNLLVGGNRSARRISLASMADQAVSVPALKNRYQFAESDRTGHVRLAGRRSAAILRETPSGLFLLGETANGDWRYDVAGNTLLRLRRNPDSLHIDWLDLNLETAVRSLDIPLHPTESLAPPARKTTAP